jgi:hypothetical protein
MQMLPPDALYPQRAEPGVALPGQEQKECPDVAVRAYGSFWERMPERQALNAS